VNTVGNENSDSIKGGQSVDERSDYQLLKKNSDTWTYTCVRHILMRRPDWLLSITKALTLGIKQPGREAEYSPPSSADVKNAWSYTSTPQICPYGVVLN
jgi:hypothetical protein